MGGLALAIGLGALGLTACGGVSGGAGGPSVGCQRASGPSLSLQLEVGGWVRHAIVHLPARAPTRAPLLLAFHGGGSSGPDMERSSGLSRLADRAGFVVAYPSATGPHAFWNLGPPVAGHAADDVAFADALIRRLVASGCIDRTRIYAVGVSNGGGLAARLGCERASELAAVVTVAGTYGHLQSCRPAQPVSVLEIHGTDDRSVPYRGDPEDGYRGAVRTWLAKWAREDGCRTSPRRAIVAPRTARLDWGPCASGTAVGHLELYGEGHVWPGADPPDPGAASPVSAAWETWRFVASHRLVPAP